MLYREVNFDGLIGPSHNYAGLSPGNIASDQHKGEIASPRQAALQGLEKMWRLVQLGQVQGVLPPASRPDIETLQRFGFSGSVPEIIGQAYRQAPHLLAACYSASTMWAANAATVSASRDCPDGRVHFTPANLITTLHRSIETNYSADMLKRIFSDPAHFCHHPSLPCQSDYADEGAANHTRLCDSHSQPGITLLVYGRGSNNPPPKRYPARQTLAACETLVRQHQLPAANVVLAQQNPTVIDQGVFHHDVIGVGHRNFLMLHQDSFFNQTRVLQQLQQQWQHPDYSRGEPLIITEFSQDLLSVREAVSSYLFNSQLISVSPPVSSPHPPDKQSPDIQSPDILNAEAKQMLLLAPTNCLASDAALKAIDWLIAGDNPVAAVEYIDLTQSMNNGGGPACLRLRVPLSQTEQNAVHPGVMLDFTLYNRLKSWINTHYREQLTADDLADPCLPVEIQAALDELTEILELPGLYPFQV
ncbi:N-succinylarginine dihydrolase [Amphritea atlantica]|uniref:N-succinylarginine dihydrolase n=1 Tax=Amphritea atlantica TaxID=355243 RepID=A0ABY5GTW8_9GAMM|nr:N-succinylarginine dihydrolase [Amphritea atlantica]